MIDKGSISHKQAIEKAEKEFAIYRKREMDLLESDFDKEIKRLKDKITPTAEVFIVTWYKSLVNMMSEQSWGYVGIFSFILLL